MASYRKLSPRNWQYIISYKDDKGKTKQKTKSGFPTKTAAKEIAEPLEVEMKRNKHVIDADTLFLEYYKNWTTTYKYGLFSPNTDAVYKTVEKLVEVHFEGMRLTDISMDYYQTFLNTLAENLAKETVRKYHNKVAACLRHAFHTGVIPVDVTYKVTVTGKASKDPLDKFLSETDLKKVVAETKKGAQFHWSSRWLIMLQAVTGMRIAEVLAITFDDIDFKKETLRINKSWDYKYTKTFKDTKNGVHRTIDLDKKTLQWLRKYTTYQKERMIAGTVKNYRNLVFTDDMFEPVSVTAVNDALRAACKRAGVREVTSHALRHTHASILLLHGVDIQIVAERLGDTVEVVSQVYAHVMDEMRERNKEEIKEISGSIF